MGRLREIVGRAGAAYALSVRQPYADLISSGRKDVLNTGRPVPSTMPQWWQCEACDERRFDVGNRTLIDHSHADGDSRYWFPFLPDGPFPLRVAIHASKTVDRDALVWAGSSWSPQGLPNGADLDAISLIDPYDLVLGEIIGVVTITGQHHAHECRNQHYITGDDRRVGFSIGRCSRWAEPDRWHYQLAHAVALDTPIPAKGRSGFWRLADEQKEAINEQVA